MQEENVRSIPRIGAVAALTAAIALGASSQAWAEGADDIRFDLTSAVSLNQLDDDKFKPAQLYTQTQWLDNDNSPVVPAEGAEEIRIDFDDDVKITTKKLPKCNADPADLGNDTTADAIDKCKKSQIGAGAAKVRFAGFPFESNEANFTVTAFNGPKSTAGPTECADTAAGGPFNCEWVGDNPVIYLHARNDATGQTSLVRGEVQSSDDVLPGAGTPPILNSHDRRLAVTDGTDVAGDVGAVSLFNAIVGKAYKYKQGNKTVKANYITARCDPDDDVDLAVPGTQTGFSFLAQTVYDDDASHGGTDPSVDTDGISTLCHTP
jgi:hypothetical protein